MQASIYLKISVLALSLASLLAPSPASSQPQLETYFSTNGHIEANVSESNYAFAGAHFSGENIASLNYNNDKVHVYYADDNCYIRTLSTEKANKLYGSKIEATKSDARKYKRAAGARISSLVEPEYDIEVAFGDRSGGMFWMGGLSPGSTGVNAHGKHYLYLGPMLPKQLKRIFRNDQLVTLVNGRGQVSMRPVNCLEPHERMMIEMLEIEAGDFLE